MFPIRDSHRTRITPWVTLLLIGISLFVFFGVQSRTSEAEQFEFLYRQAAISCEILTGEPLSLREINGGPCSEGAGVPVFEDKSPYLAILISMFLHGGVGHVLFNMWFLWIFGNNVEEAFGHLRYLIFYVVGGVAATLVFVAMNPDSVVPLVGASGAIAAVLGSYAVLFPRHRVTSLVVWFLVAVPAWLFLGIWFVAQFGLGGTNVAWEAHAGGFVFGLVATLPFRRRLLRRVR